jgi:transcriptional regulator with XRE-family HTH domain
MRIADIVKLRKALGLTQEQLAKRIGAPYRGTIARWETGKSKPHHLYLEKLEKLLLKAKKRAS